MQNNHDNCWVNVPQLVAISISTVAVNNITI